MGFREWAVLGGGDDLDSGFVVRGTFAGENLAAVLAHLAREPELSPPLATGVFPHLCRAVTHSGGTRSRAWNGCSGGGLISLETHVSTSSRKGL